MNPTLVSTGDIPNKYSIIGIVGARVDNTDSTITKAPSCGGCGGGNTTARIYVSTDTTYKRGADALLAAAKDKGGNAVVFARFEHRIAIEMLSDAGGAVKKIFDKTASDSKASQVLELLCSGTAVKVED